MKPVFLRLVAVVALAAGAPAAAAQGVLPPDQIMQPHLAAEERFGLWMGAALGLAAVLGGLANFYVVLSGRPQPTAPTLTVEPAPAPGPKGRRGPPAAGSRISKSAGPPRKAPFQYTISGGVLGVLAGSYFVWMPLGYIRPRVQQAALQQQRKDLRRRLDQDLMAMNYQVRVYNNGHILRGHAQPDSAAVPLGLFFSYVRAGAVGLNEDLGNGTLLDGLVNAHHPDTVRTLLAAGASPEAHDPGQLSPLLLAINNLDVADVRLLLAAHANPNAAANNNLPIFEAINPDPNEDSTGLSPARAEARRQVVAALVAAGARLDVRDERSYTPLMIAAATGQCNLLPVLLAGHPDRTLRAKTGETALDWALSEHPACAPLLRAAPPRGPRAGPAAAAPHFTHGRAASRPRRVRHRGVRPPAIHALAGR